MRKILFLFSLLAVCGCNKKSAPTPAPTPDATVVYHFTTNATATYDIRYAGPGGKLVSTTFTGTDFSKTVIANKASGFTAALLFIGLTSPNTVITGEAGVRVNDEELSHVHLTFDSGSGSTDLSFGPWVFR